MLEITYKDSDWSPRYFGIIVGLLCGLYITTIAINVKMVDFYGLIIPAGLITFPLCCVITDLLTEIYGFNRTRQAIWTAVFLTISFAIFTQIAILLKPATLWPDQAAFEAVFSLSWRFAAAGCLAWLAGEFVNSYALSRMKISQNAHHMSIRFIGSTIIGQFFDTAVFMVIAFGGTMSWKEIFSILCTAWAFKIIYEIVALPLSVPITKWVKKLEGIEHFDKQKLRMI